MSVVGLLSLFVFSGIDETRRWETVNDVVMGGISRSAFDFTLDSQKDPHTLHTAYAHFHGVVSLENNGGFASVRSPLVSHNLVAYDAIRISICGDGKRYKFRLRDDHDLSGVSFQASFIAPNNTWTEIDIPFSEFRASYRGRDVPNHPPLRLHNICNYGFLVADKQHGPFSLRVASIAAVKLSSGFRR
eukprot:TRINITY_DN3839_c0_g1_i13.p1 TRINITY_DN3839_c0_g1~~TRINITY_DN3839_c0_g1_i13.p1  ORF type:complete len:188 (+),score=34.03 TRINITY_DN3839_c0_g1_i13:59-622(+)